MAKISKKVQAPVQKQEEVSPLLAAYRSLENAIEAWEDQKDYAGKSIDRMIKSAQSLVEDLEQVKQILNDQQMGISQGVPVMQYITEQALYTVSSYASRSGVQEMSHQANEVSRYWGRVLERAQRFEIQQIKDGIIEL